MIKPRFYFLIFFCFVTSSSFSQEFECEVNLNYDLLEGNSYSYLTELESRIEEYINDYNWTEAQFEEHERIQCQIQLIIESGNSNFDFGYSQLADLFIIPSQKQLPLFSQTNCGDLIIRKEEL